MESVIKESLECWVKYFTYLGTCETCCEMLREETIKLFLSPSDSSCGVCVTFYKIHYGQTDKILPSATIFTTQE